MCTTSASILRHLCGTAEEEYVHDHLSVYVHTHTYTYICRVCPETSRGPSCLNARLDAHTHTSGQMQANGDFNHPRSAAAPEHRARTCLCPNFPSGEDGTLSHDFRCATGAPNLSVQCVCVCTRAGTRIIYCVYYTKYSISCICLYGRTEWERM